MQIKTKIVPCLWFDDQAEAAAKLYTSIFKGKIHRTTHYTAAGQEQHGRKPGSVMTVEFELAGQTFTALNGGPIFKFTEAISLQVMCDTQDEIDHFWSKLTADGGQESFCGWLKDKFGLSWQISPTMMAELFSDKDPQKAGRAMNAMLKMRKLDIAELKRAAAGK